MSYFIALLLQLFFGRIIEGLEREREGWATGLTYLVMATIQITLMGLGIGVLLGW